MQKAKKKSSPNSGARSMRNSTKSVRERVLHAAFDAFMAHGYERASTLEIATRASVSKRELYALFDNKQAMLAACIAERAKRMRLPLELPAARDRQALAITLAAFGTAVLRGASHPAVLAVYRLAIAEAGRSPEVAQVLNTVGRKANQAALADLLAVAQTHGLLGAGEAAKMATQFFALLWGDLFPQLLLGVTDPPSPQEIERRARTATETLLILHPEPNNRHCS
jgi:AcrR family transcriptional regulator